MDNSETAYNLFEQTLFWQFIALKAIHQLIEHAGVNEVSAPATSSEIVGDVQFQELLARVSLIERADDPGYRTVELKPHI